MTEKRSFANGATRQWWLRVSSLACAAALAVGCGSKPPANPPRAPAPAAPVASPPPPPPPAPPEPAHAAPTPAAQQQAQKIAASVVDLLEAGIDETAYVELLNALQLDPNNKLALNLFKQMNEDPVQALGRESFAYVVRPGDTLSKIAGRFLGDIYAFHILARYNNIKVPRQVGEGQTIRVPGKAPPVVAATPAPAPAAREPAKPAVVAAAPSAEAAAPAAEPAEAAFRSARAAAGEGKLDRAVAEYRRAAGLGHPSAAAQADALVKRQVDDHSRAARAAFARQDLDGAVRSWDRVLAIEPGNETAKLERQKALRLKDKVKAL